MSPFYSISLGLRAGGDVADEPTNGELARRLDDILRLVAGLVGHAEYAAEMRRVDERVADMRRDFDEKLKAVHQRITDEQQVTAAHRMSWRTIIYTGLVPAAVVLASILVQLWIASHGGGHR